MQEWRNKKQPIEKEKLNIIIERLFGHHQGKPITLEIKGYC